MFEFIAEFIYNFLQHFVMTSDNFFVNVVLLMAWLVLVNVIIVLLAYVGLGAFLQCFMKLKKQRNSGLAFVPVYQFYLLGKFAINKAVGWVLIIAFFAIELIDFVIDSEMLWWRMEDTQEALQHFVAGPLTTIYWVAIIVIFIIALTKYLQARAVALHERREQYRKKVS